MFTLVWHCFLPEKKQTTKHSSRVHTSISVVSLSFSLSDCCFFLLRSCLNWVITNKQIDNLHTMWMIVIWNVIILLLLLPLYHPFCEISIQDLTHTKCETNRENGLHKWIFMLLLHILCYFQSLSVGLCVSISLFLMHLCASKSFEGTLYLSSFFVYFLRWRSAMHTHTPTPFPTWIRGMTVWLVVTFVSRVYYFHLMS